MFFTFSLPTKPIPPPPFPPLNNISRKGPVYVPCNLRISTISRLLCTFSESQDCAIYLHFVRPDNRLEIQCIPCGYMMARMCTTKLDLFSKQEMIFACELVIIYLLLCSVDTWCWTICIYNYIFQCMMAHQLPRAPNKGSFWRLVRGEDGDVFSQNERGLRSTTAGTMPMKSKAHCKWREWYQNCNYVLCEVCQWPSQISNIMFQHTTQCSLVSQLCVQYWGSGNQLGSVHTLIFLDRFLMVKEPL